MNFPLPNNGYDTRKTLNFSSLSMGDMSRPDTKVLSFPYTLPRHSQNKLGYLRTASKGPENS
jgi:hypothetical protein